MKGGKSKLIWSELSNYLMSEIIIKEAIKKRDRGLVYRINKQGDLVSEKYNWFKDPYSLVTICVIIMSLSYYYYAIHNNPLAVKNIDNTCEALSEICFRYMPLKDKWLEENPGKEFDVREVINTKVYVKTEYESPRLNISLLK